MFQGKGTLNLALIYCRLCFDVRVTSKEVQCLLCRMCQDVVRELSHSY